MFDSGALAALRKSDPARQVVMVLSTSARPDIKAVKLLEPASARRQALFEFYASAKKAVLDEAETLEGDKMTVVSPLPGTHQAIVSAPASLWLRIARDPASAFADPAMDVEPNSAMVSLP